ncbi:hypothetical protein B7Z28_00540 [Candidatus Saccharibacteria bacterium 32-45-3]|nr:MAG: hypothetical protein B7Z28_00540 [Candidatus Saccharibacteria bacterium 32-45-3]
MNYTYKHTHYKNLKKKLPKTISNRSGFTIIELLVVIVVIGILATITVTGYNGVKERALSTKAASIANSYARLLQLYKSETGSYPLASQSSIYICMGEPSHYPAETGMYAGNCTHTSSTVGNGTDSSLNAMLKAYTPALPDSRLPTVDAYGELYRGIVYSKYASDFSVIYKLSGNQSCPGGSKYYDNGNVWFTTNRPHTECQITLK